MKTMIRHLLYLAASLVLVCAQSHSQDLEKQFTAPPDSARPWVYWFWLNGNITSNGITADLEAMKRVGIGGVLIMEVDQGAPVGPADFMSERWRELFSHVDTEAKRLGLEVNMNNDAGWNGSGGPWIKPEESMQKVVWSETNVSGPAHVELTLQQPETVAGYYRDISVMAFPATGSFRIDGIRGKAAYEVAGVGEMARSNLPPDMVVDGSRMVTVTDKMDASGKFTWDVPPGQWTIARFGHTSTGAENAPAPKTGRGLECDKLSKAGIEANYAGMMAKLIADNGKPAAAAGLMATHIDSWENGSQNWTPAMREEFGQRRGYDPLHYLPVLTGRVVDSMEVSDRFLWDLRQTVSELVIDNYAGRMHELASADGLRFTCEAYGGPCDSIPYAGRSDEPMGEFWSPSGSMETCKSMAAAGHIYGKRIIGAEAFTAGDQERWREHPASIKALGDHAFCEGINRFVFHRYAMQPWAEPREPGMTMGPWGQHYERTQTWWDWTPAWHTYLARCQLMLREGLFVADVCHLLPEAPPQGPVGHDRSGYDWDECTSEAVLTRMSVSDGKIVLPDGMSYRLLVLPESRSMTPQLLRKIKDLVEAGATVLGSKPTASPSLNDYPSCDAVVDQLGTELWADCNGTSVKEHAFGKGRVLCELTPVQALQKLGVATDFASNQRLRHIHRTTGDTDLYFVSNPQNTPVTANCSFRIAGKMPELWWPETGLVERAAMYREDNGLTHVTFSLPPSGSVFVVFRNPGAGIDPIVQVTRNGKSVVAVSDSQAPKIVVSKARYGLLDDPQYVADVTAKVQEMADRGERDFQVSAMAQEHDPAFNKIKTLVVDYTIGDRTFVVKGTDPDRVHLGEESVRATVQSARYGVLADPARTRNVRERLQRLIDSGESRFTVARMADRDDPAFGVVKKLEAELTVNGKPLSVSGFDPDVLDLAALSAIRVAGTSVPRTVGQRTIIEAATPGDYHWTLASGKTDQRKVSNLGSAIQLTRPWKVRLNETVLTFDKLTSWSLHASPEVKYFSGTAVYTCSFDVSKKLLSKNRRLYLDLGRVECMARVVLNGKDLGVLWKAPFRLDVTGVAQTGQNALEVKVVNLWINRMIGDEQLPEDSDRNPDGTLKAWPQWLNEGKPSPTGRRTFTSWRLWKKDSPLQDSGLLGPVTLQPVEWIEVGN